MKSWIFHAVALSWALFGAAEVSARGASLGVYVHTLYTGRSITCEEAVVYGSVSEVDLRVSLVNEEGGRAIVLLAPIEALADWSLTQDGKPFAPEDFEVVVKEAPGKVDISGRGNAIDGIRTDLLEPEVSLQHRMVLKTRHPLKDGLFRLDARLDEGKLAFADKETWSGRGLRGGTLFRVIGQASEEDLPRQLVAESSRFLAEGQPQAAVAILQRLTALNPEEQGYWDRLGRAQVVAKDFAGAVRSFERIDASGKRGDERAAILPFIASAYLATGQRAKAKAVLRQTYLSDAEADAEIRRMEQSMKSPKVN